MSFWEVAGLEEMAGQGCGRCFHSRCCLQSYPHGGPRPPQNACGYPTDSARFWTGSGQNTRVRTTPYSRRSEARSGFGTIDVTAAHYNSWATGYGYARVDYGPDGRLVWCDAGAGITWRVLVGCNYVRA